MRHPVTFLYNKRQRTGLDYFKLAPSHRYMRVKFLIHVASQNQRSWIAKCPAVPRTSILYSLRQEAIEDLRGQLVLFLEIEGKKYLSSLKGNSEIVNCPEGFVDLPIDLWKCQINRQLCPTQSQVYITDKEKFLIGCNAPKERKEAIFNTSQNPEYWGHHILGRYLCPLCSGEKELKEYFRYHYPWELTPIDEFFDLFDTEFRKTFLKAGIALAAYSSSLCPRHLKEVISKIDWDLGENLEILELNLSR